MKKQEEQKPLTPKQKARNIILSLIVFFDNYSKQDLFDYSKKKMKEQNIEGQLTDQEIWDVINKVMDNYIQEGVYELDERGYYHSVAKKVD